MIKERPYVLSIAGYDPSGGAGVLADVKTLENIGVYGLGVTTCITYQNDSAFEGVSWLSKKKIKNQLYPLLNKYDIRFAKIGLIKNVEVLSEIMELLKGYKKDIKIIWDPVMSASAGFSFHKKLSRKYLHHIFDTIDMVTPNWEEIFPLSAEEDVIAGAEKIAKLCNVYLKGGHNVETPGTDLVWINKKLNILHPKSVTELSKHGTGCVLSSAIGGYLAMGNSMLKSCEMAKDYTYRFLISNDSNLGYHSSH